MSTIPEPHTPVARAGRAAESDFAKKLDYTCVARIDDNGVISGELKIFERTVSAWVMDTRDKQIREGLIKLGWTPPPEELHGLHSAVARGDGGETK